MTEMRLTFSAGRWAKKELLGIIKSRAFANNVKCEIENHGGGWAETHYGLSATGEIKNIVKFKDEIEEIFKANEETT